MTGFKGWEIPEQVELTDWKKLFDQAINNNEQIYFHAEVIPSDMRSIAHIRHSAVHRLPTSNHWIRRIMFPSALRIVWATGDDDGHDKLLELQKAMNSGKYHLVLLLTLRYSNVCSNI